MEGIFCSDMSSRSGYVCPSGWYNFAMALNIHVSGSDFQEDLKVTLNSQLTPK